MRVPDIADTPPEPKDIPPFIAVDQEGGFVLRMRDAFPRVPSEQQMGENGDSGNARTGRDDGEKAEASWGST